MQPETWSHSLIRSERESEGAVFKGRVSQAPRNSDFQTIKQSSPIVQSDFRTNGLPDNQTIRLSSYGLPDNLTFKLSKVYLGPGMFDWVTIKKSKLNANDNFLYFKASGLDPALGKL